MPKPTRPLGVTVVSILWSVAAAYLLFGAWQMWNGLFGRAPSSLVPQLVKGAPYLAVFGVAFGMIGFGLWFMQNWARITTIVCVSLDLARRALFLVLVGAFTTEAHRNPAPWHFLMWAATDLMWAASEATICVYLMREVVNRKFQESAVS